ncbi:uncharacterized protein METZ01_LOCUS339886, partial [marine metagenome]
RHLTQRRSKGWFMQGRTPELCSTEGRGGSRLKHSCSPRTSKTGWVPRSRSIPSSVPPRLLGLRRRNTGKPSAACLTHCGLTWRPFGFTRGQSRSEAGTGTYSSTQVRPLATTVTAFSKRHSCTRQPTHPSTRLTPPRAVGSPPKPPMTSSFPRTLVTFRIARISQRVFCSTWPSNSGETGSANRSQRRFWRPYRTGSITSAVCHLTCTQSLTGTPLSSQAHWASSRACIDD